MLGGECGSGGRCVCEQQYCIEGDFRGRNSCFSVNKLFIFFISPPIPLTMGSTNTQRLIHVHAEGRFQTVSGGCPS